jgi:hypothetical protein
VRGLTPQLDWRHRSPAISLASEGEQQQEHRDIARVLPRQLADATDHIPAHRSSMWPPTGMHVQAADVMHDP